MKIGLGSVFGLLMFVPVLSHAAETLPPIKILDLSSYTAGAAFSDPLRNGLDMAQSEINQAGGVLGRPIEFVHIDDTGTPNGAITKLEQFYLTEKPAFITGCNLANIELAISAYAKKNKILFIGACTNSDEAAWKYGHEYFYRGTGPMMYSFNWMLAERAAKKGNLRWGTVNHNYAWGQQNLAAFKENLAKYLPDAKWETEQWVSVGKIDAGSVINNLLRNHVDAVYTSLWGSDLSQFLREAKKRGLLEKVTIVGDNIGRPEFMEVLGDTMPKGIITIGTLPDEYPVTPAMKKFAVDYKARFHDIVGYTSLQGYFSAYVMKAALEKAQSLENEGLAKALNGLQMPKSIAGPITVRTIDHVPNNGIWVCETDVKDGKAHLTNVEYKDGASYLPSDEYIENLRK